MEPVFKATWAFMPAVYTVQFALPTTSAVNAIERVFSTGMDSVMQNSKKANIRKALASLAATHEIVVNQMEHMINLLNHVLDAEESLEFQSGDTNSNFKTNRPIANRKTFSIEWADKSCFLGNTLLFWFFERIARTPNQYVSHLDLLEDVWGGERKEATIRGVAKRLRDRLADSGMEYLALSIDGSESGYYGLILV